MKLVALLMFVVLAAQVSEERFILIQLRAL
jgi:hypothetical protein